MTKREAIQTLISLASHFEYQCRTRTYIDSKTNTLKTYTPSESQVDFNTEQIAKLNSVIDFMFSN